MAWNEPGGDNKDPWGSKNNGNNQGPPDLDEVAKKVQESLNKIFGGAVKAAALAVRKCPTLNFLRH